MQFTLQEEFRQLRCSDCGVTYFFPERWCCERADDKRGWNCPNGHGQVFRESEADRLRRERDRLKQETSRLEDENRLERERAERAEAVAARLRKRIRRGVCPCCNRTFANVARHMKSKHPNVAPIKGGAA